LQDRLQKIQQIIRKYGEENFYISFSGGKDSTVLSALVDMAIGSQNKIPRVYANTGIELQMIKDFVFKKAETGERIVIIAPSVPIKPMLERDGYPFKSKSHSKWHERYTRIGKSEGVLQYLSERTDKKAWSSQSRCPNCLKYQFSPDFTLKISDKCCVRMKEEPLDKWSKENNKPFSIIGIMREEAGRRNNAQCLAFNGGAS